MEGLSKIYTGERMIPEKDKEGPIYLEHMSRYSFASQFVTDKIVLDVACGVGYGSGFLRDQKARRVIGVDYSKETISYAKQVYQKEGVEFIVAEAENLPFENESIDVIVSFETIEHLHNQTKFLHEIKRLLKPDGILIISTPNSLVYPPTNVFHIKELDPEEFQTLLRNFFLNTKMYYQNTVLSNCIFSKDDLAETGPKIMLENFKLTSSELWEAMYLIGIASDTTLPKVTGVNTIFNDLEIKKLRNQLEAQKTIIETIYSSRGYKIITFLHKVRKSIPFLKNI